MSTKTAARSAVVPSTQPSFWQHVKATPGMGVEEQWIYRWKGRVPAISLRRTLNQDWYATLLIRSGISTLSMLVNDCTLAQAQEHALKRLRNMGWEE